MLSDDYDDSELFNGHFITRLMLSLTVKEFIKSVNISEVNYRQE